MKIARISTIQPSLSILLGGQLAFLSNNGYEVYTISGEGGNYVDFVKREKIKEHHMISLTRPISLIKDLKALLECYLLFRRIKPDIIHSITPKAGLIAMLAGYLAGVPVRIHTFTGLIFPYKKGLFQKILIFMDKILCRCATHIYPEGQGVKNDLIKYNITKKPLKIIGNGNVNGVDLNHYNPSDYSEVFKNEFRESLNIDREDFVFIFVGRLVGDKGINEMVVAFKHFCKNNFHVKLLLVGPFEEGLDPLKPETLIEIEQNSQIINVGYQEDVRPFFAVSDALIFPSYREGFPNVVLQAGAMGLPCIVTDISGCNEIIAQGKNGIIIPVKDEGAILGAFMQMFENKDLRLKLSEEARHMIASRFDQKSLWEAILIEYNSFKRV